jgi:hypothetical protein
MAAALAKLAEKSCYRSIQCLLSVAKVGFLVSFAENQELLTQEQYLELQGLALEGIRVDGTFRG